MAHLRLYAAVGPSTLCVVYVMAGSEVEDRPQHPAGPSAKDQHPGNRKQRRCSPRCSAAGGECARCWWCFLSISCTMTIETIDNGCKLRQLELGFSDEFSHDHCQPFLHDSRGQALLPRGSGGFKKVLRNHSCAHALQYDMTYADCKRLDHAAPSRRVLMMSCKL